MKNNKTIIWIIIIALAIFIIGPKLGLFSITGLTTGCNSTEPLYFNQLLSTYQSWTNISFIVISNASQLQPPFLFQNGKGYILNYIANDKEMFFSTNYGQSVGQATFDLYALELPTTKYGLNDGNCENLVIRE